MRLTLSLCTGCSQVSVGANHPGSGGEVTISFGSNQLTPAQSHSITLHIWSPGIISLSLSDNTLSRVRGWRDACDTDQFVYQTARVIATTEFTSGSDSFTADIVDIIINNVSSIHPWNIITYLLIHYTYIPLTL